MARRVISDADARRLVNMVNRRMGAITLLTSGHFSWQAWLIHGIAYGAAAGWVGISGRKEDWLLFCILLAILTLLELYNTALNRRIDAATELLQQAGMLDIGLPAGSVPEE